MGFFGKDDRPQPNKAEIRARQKAVADRMREERAEAKAAAPKYTAKKLSGYNPKKQAKQLNKMAEKGWEAESVSSAGLLSGKKMFTFRKDR
ncbi:Uncharacterised protein [Brevibacterium casei]|uniref:Uncharacterized protein n=2 Tax=Brevibacterium casei TaxID=33889 RepID=A0A449D7P7_9MICO|nr:Uncharacterised protein [Brevibacterium casei]